ncbi:single-stranded DNA-binding protein [Apibacter muscae]|uniref:Single-stranded DNA-binding protein n=1 Tax=Apibacter muscae TaxID=2509004 RepID=A0A563DDQ1_9FLAO|nr:ERF family protein [Apibacter muscae]TWP28458.1 single-stranded DNA-binding protein [Apibacter muscae]
MNTENKTNIYQKLLKIQEEIRSLGKDTKGYNYQYVSGSKVLNNIKPIMNKYGLLLKQEVLDLENIRIDYNQNKEVIKSEILSKLKLKFTWIDVVTGEKDENVFFANGMNGWDKGVGSALTYAERYFLLKYFHISTDEDDLDSLLREEDLNEILKSKDIELLISFGKEWTTEPKSMTPDQSIALKNRIKELRGQSKTK